MGADGLVSILRIFNNRRARLGIIRTLMTALWKGKLQFKTKKDLLMKETGILYYFMEAE